MKHILVVSVEFPPKVSVGGLRVAKLCRYLPIYGWEPIVLTVPITGFHIKAVDPTTGKAILNPVSIPQSIKVYNTPVLNPYVMATRAKRLIKRLLHPTNTTSRTIISNSSSTNKTMILRSFLLKVLDTLCVPDPYISWVPLAVVQGLYLIRRYRVEALFSSFPPLSSHIVAYLLHCFTKLPWVADFRDALSSDPVAKITRLDRYVRKKWEARIINKATSISCVGHGIAELLSQQGSRTIQKKLLILPQGFDPSERPNSSSQKRSGDVLKIVYAGNTGKVYANPELFLEALAHKVMMGKIKREQLHVTFVGNTNDANRLISIVSRFGITDMVEIRPFIPREKVIKLLNDADVQILFSTVRGRIWITGKIWDYLTVGKYILAIVDPESEAAKVIQETGMGSVVPFWDMRAVGESLENIYNAWKMGTLQLQPNAEALEQYEIRNICHKLISKLNMFVLKRLR